MFYSNSHVFLLDILHLFLLIHILFSIFFKMLKYSELLLFLYHVLVSSNVMIIITLISTSSLSSSLTKLVNTLGYKIQTWTQSQPRWTIICWITKVQVLQAAREPISLITFLHLVYRDVTSELFLDVLLNFRYTKPFPLFLLLANKKLTTLHFKIYLCWVYLNLLIWRFIKPS